MKTPYLNYLGYGKNLLTCSMYRNDPALLYIFIICDFSHPICLADKTIRLSHCLKKIINPNYSVTHSYRSARSIKSKANSQCINLFLTCLNYHFQTTYKEKPDENGRVVFEFPELVTEKITVKIIKKKKNVEVTITDFTVKACLPGKKKERSYYICNTFQYFLSD